MAKGVSLHIGLNEVSQAHYRDGNGNPWRGVLYACENDAGAMAELAASQGFEIRGPILTSDATASRVLDELHRVAGDLTPGDIFFLTYSGHGGQVENTNPEDDPEDDRLDETWCLYDRELLDDELFAVFSEFKPGVRVVVFSDSCHSGSITRGDPPVPAADEPRYKQLPADVAVATEKASAALYAALQHDVPSKRRTTVAATVVLLSGCQDDELSRDGRTNGAFTGALLEAWKKPDARRSLKSLVDAVSAEIPPAYGQHPNYSVYCFDIAPPLTV